MPFYTIEAKLADGGTIKLGEPILAVHKGFILPGRVAFIDMTDNTPTIRAVIDDVLSHTLNVGIKPNPAQMQIGPGLRHISDPVPNGIRFCRMKQEEYNFLKEWHDKHGATGGTGDPSQHPDPSSIPWTPWQSSGGKQGEEVITGPDVVEGQGGGGKDTGEGDFTGAPDDRTEYHEADTNRDGLISREEKKAWNKKNPGSPVETGEY